jgi:hypothetical protein
MKMITKKALAYSFILFINFQAFAQETKGNNEKESRKGMQQLSLVVSHSHITEGESANGGKEWIVVPAWGLDYNYWLSNHWAIGLHSDMMLQSFKVKDGDAEEGSTLERKRPLAVVPVAVFKPLEHSSFIVGLGQEFAPEGNLTLMRLGYEYGLEINDKWEFCAGLTYDLKFNVYNTWTLGLGISRSFRFNK